MGMISGIGGMIGARRQRNQAEGAYKDLRGAYANAGDVPEYQGYQMSQYAGPGAYADPGAYTTAGQASGYVNELYGGLGVGGPVDYRDQARSAYMGAADDVLAAAGASGVRGGAQTGSNLRALNQAGVTSGLANIEANYANQQSAYDQNRIGQAMGYGQNLSAYNLGAAGQRNQYQLGSAGMQNQFNLDQDRQRASEAMRGYQSDMNAYNMPLQQAQTMYNARLGYGNQLNQSAQQFGSGMGDVAQTAGSYAMFGPGAVLQQGMG